ncbi:MAG: hypothetical protein R3D67_06965 [Hyphomicrobiaceae bacterium]
MLWLIADPEGGSEVKGWILLTALDDRRVEGADRPAPATGRGMVGRLGGDNRMDHRIKTVAYEDREPAVVVIGGSQSGLGIAARLKYTLPVSIRW